MKTDQQLLAIIGTLEAQLGSRRKPGEGRCPVRMRINHLRWRLKTRTFVPAAEAAANKRVGHLKAWQTHPSYVAIQEQAAERRARAQAVKEERQRAREARRAFRAPQIAEKDRRKALLHYHNHAIEINRARRTPIDRWFRRAIKKVKARRIPFFKAIRRLEKKIANRPACQIKRGLRRRLQKVVSANISFSKTARELLGCEVLYLKKHLESLWKPGMSWENYGFRGWHIDHIKPCAAFDLTNPQDQKECFHYTNLQPLWAAENFKKRDKVIDSSPSWITPFAV